MRGAGILAALEALVGDGAAFLFLGRLSNSLVVSMTTAKRIGSAGGFVSWIIDALRMDRPQAFLHVGRMDRVGSAYRQHEHRG